VRSRYKLLSDAVIVPGYRTDKTHWRSVAVEVRPKPVSSHGTRFILRAAAGIRVQRYAGHVLSGQQIVKTMPSLFVIPAC
jgi:hypothetical protein